MSSQSNGSSQRSMGGSQSVMVAEITSKRDFTSLGTGALALELVGPVFREIGPQCVDIEVHGKGYNAVNGFSYRVLAQFSYDGESWENFANALLTVAAADVNKTRIDRMNRPAFPSRPINRALRCPESPRLLPLQRPLPRPLPRPLLPPRRWPVRPGGRVG